MGMNDQFICFHDGENVTYAKISADGGSINMTPELLEAMDAEGIKGGEIGLLIYAIKLLISKLKRKDEDPDDGTAAKKGPFSFRKSTRRLLHEQKL